MITLSLLRSPVVALDWHEAIAVSAALTTLVVDGHLAGVPRLDEVALLPDGRLQLTGPPPGPEPVAAALSARLASLIESGPCPSELRQFVDRQRSDPAEPDSLERFAEGLAFFERPDRHEMLQALALRASDALERARLADEIERLTERARQQASLPLEAGPTDTPARRLPVDYARLYALPIVVPAAVFLAMAVAAATWFNAPFHEGADVRDAEEAADSPVPGGAASPGAGEPEPGEVPVEAVPPSTMVEAEPLGRPRRPGPSGGGSPTPTPTPGASVRRGLDVRVSELGGGAVPSSAAASAARGSSPTASGRVYTTADRGVKPARLVRPHLPAEPPPDVPPEQVGTLELLVNEQGTVDHVALISPSNRYQERMLVSAAKAWQFDPATRQGQPVRFRARIRVTL